MKTILLCGVAVVGALGCSSTPEAGGYERPPGEPLLVIPAAEQTTAETRVASWLHFRDELTGAYVGVTSGGEVVTDLRIRRLSAAPGSAIEFATEYPLPRTVRTYSSAGELIAESEERAAPAANAPVIAARFADDVGAFVAARGEVGVPYDHCDPEIVELLRWDAIVAINEAALVAICILPTGATLAACLAAQATLAASLISLGNAGVQWALCHYPGLCPNMACGSVSPHTHETCCYTTTGCEQELIQATSSSCLVNDECKGTISLADGTPCEETGVCAGGECVHPPPPPPPPTCCDDPTLCAEPDECDLNTCGCVTPPPPPPPPDPTCCDDASLCTELEECDTAACGCVPIA